ncbi:8156_t:CDS:2, partial [Scutellospora calospora]
VVKNYSASAIVNIVKEYTTEKLDISISDGYSCWNVSEHFFISNEDSDMVTEVLVIMWQFCSFWKPQYFLSDQSSVEARSIITAFPGLQKGEQEYEVVLCTIHVI